MNNKNYLSVSGSLFLVIGIVHLMRIVSGWEAVIGGWSAPMWVSWVAAVVAGYLAYSAFHLSRR